MNDIQLKRAEWRKRKRKHLEAALFREVEAEAEAEAVMKKLMEAEAEAEALKKKTMEAEAEAITKLPLPDTLNRTE